MVDEDTLFMRRASPRLIVTIVAFLAHICGGCAPSPKQMIAGSEFSPDHWSQQDRDRYFALQSPSHDESERVQNAAVSSKGMVAGTTSEPFEGRAGLGVLTRGGNPAEAP